MVAISISDFGGMIPVRESRLLPNNYAELTKNVWLYNGDLRGLNASTAIHTMTLPGAKYAYRIPADPQFPDVLETSYWLEFTDENTDVIRSPVAGDQYHRYYWTNPTDGPHYNSFVRIGNSSSPLKLGVPAPTSFPGVAPSKGVIDPVAAAAAAAAAAANPVLTTTWTLYPGTAPKNYNAFVTSGDDSTLVAAIPGGNISVSTDAGKSWTDQTSSGERNWSDVCVSTSGSKIAACVNGGSIWTSTNSGTTWTERTAAGSRNWWTICCSSDGAKIHAAEQGGSIWTSLDSGATWTERTAAGSRTWVTICCSSDGARVIAAGSDTYIYLSTNSGSLWTERTSAGQLLWESSCITPDGGTVYIAGTPTKIWKSSDGGATFTEIASTEFENWKGLACSGDGGTVAAAAYTGTVWVSRDTGATFVSSGVDAGTPSGDIIDVAVTYDGSQVMAAVTAGGISYSTTTTIGGDTASDAPLTESRVYLYTWVTQFGEEGAPSAPSPVVAGQVDDSWNITITPPTSSDTTGRLLEKTRLYRTITSSLGTASYFFVAEFPISTTTYSDATTDDQITTNQICQSMGWTPPPDDLQGMISMANGMIAGWRENEVWFSEPYRPHAWPAAYSISVEYPVVGLGAMGQSLLICTTGYPILASGIRPENISTTKSQTLEPCVSRKSILGTDAGIYYASPNGLIQAANGMVVNATRALIEREGWQTTLDPKLLMCARLGLGYAAYEKRDSGTSRGVLVDGIDQRVAFNLLEDTAIQNIMSDVWTGQVMTLKGNVISLVHPVGQPMMPYLWKSHLFNLGMAKNLGVLQVVFDARDDITLGDENNTLDQTLADNQYGIIRIFSGGRHVATREIRRSNAMIRLPCGFKDDTLQIEVEARVRIKSIDLAPTIKDLRVV